MLQNWDVFFKWFSSLSDKISLSHSEQAELKELRLSSDASAYQRRREIFSKYIGLLLQAIILDIIGCSIPSLASKIGCSKQRLYRIINGRVIQGLYEIFCILYLLGLPFPKVFASFVPDSILKFRKIIEHRRDMKDQSVCMESSPEPEDICRTLSSDSSVQEPSCTDPAPIRPSAEEHPLSSDNVHPFGDSPLSVFRSENDELLLYIPLQDIHRSSDRSSPFHIPSGPDSRSGKRTVRPGSDLKSGIRISIPASLVSSALDCYVGVQEPFPLP